MNPAGPEPQYDGNPLSYWASMALDQSMDHKPSSLALEAIAAVRHIGTQAIPHLLAWIQPPFRNSMLPCGAVHSFKALGLEAESAIPELVRLFEKYKPSRPFSDLDFSAWVSVVEALSYLGPKALTLLLRATKEGLSQDFTHDVIQHLGNFGQDALPAIPDLIEWTRHPKQPIRWAAVNALGQIAKAPAMVIPALMACLKDPDLFVRRDAGRALGRFGKAARDCAPELMAMTDDPDWHAQTGPMIALAQIGERAEVVLPLLAGKLHEGNRKLRRCAAIALGILGGHAAFDVLMEATDDPDGSVREAVFQSLKKIDPAALEKSGKKFYINDLRDSW